MFIESDPCRIFIGLHDADLATNVVFIKQK